MLDLKFASWVFLIFLGAIAFAGETIDLAKLAEKVRPSVMLVIAERDSAAQKKEYGPFADLVPKTATGSGFFISCDGKFVTNHHVIEKAAKIILKGENGAFYEVQGLLADDAVADVAILQVAAKNVQFLEIGASQTAQVGQHIAVIGSPMGLEGTLSEGIISAKRDLGEKGEWLQMTAGISPGSSGSPVLDASGKVIGIATMLLREGQSLNFAVPSDRIQRALSTISKSGTVRPLTAASGTLGDDPDFKKFWKILDQDVDQDAAESLKLAKQITLHYPNNPIGYWFLGLALAAMDFKDEALEAFNHSLKIDRDFVGALVASADLLESKGERASALKGATRALSIDPDYAEAWFTYGKVLRLPVAKADYEQAAEIRSKAIDAFARVISVESKTNSSRLTRAAWLNIAELKAETGDACNSPTYNTNFKAALPYYKQAIEPQKHAIAVAGYNETRVNAGVGNEGTLSVGALLEAMISKNVGVGRVGTLSAHLTASFLWHKLFTFYWEAFVCEEMQAGEESIRTDALQQLQKLEKQDPELAKELRVGSFKDLNHAAGERSRKTRRDIEKVNRQKERLQEEGLLPPDNS